MLIRSITIAAATVLASLAANPGTAAMAADEVLQPGLLHLVDDDDDDDDDGPRRTYRPRAPVYGHGQVYGYPRHHPHGYGYSHGYAPRAVYSAGPRCRTVWVRDDWGRSFKQRTCR